MHLHPFSRHPRRPLDDPQPVALAAPATDPAREERRWLGPGDDEDDDETPIGDPDDDEGDDEDEEDDDEDTLWAARAPQAAPGRLVAAGGAGRGPAR